MGNFESREEVFEIESTVLDNLADLHVEYCAIENNIDHVMQRLQVFQPFNQLLVTTSSTEQCAKDLVGNDLVTIPKLTYNPGHTPFVNDGKSG